jgi:vacuolar protein sorting-associated protein 54
VCNACCDGSTSLTSFGCFLFCEITATHLALASQSVGLLITQIPVLRSILSTRLPVKHHVLLSALERVKSDCEEHQREIWGKLSGIMGELIRGMVEKLEQLPWTKLESIGVQTTPTIPEESDRVDEPVKTLMKQTCSLHRALSDLLLVEQRDAIFTDISSLFLTTLREFLSEVDTKNSYVKLKVSYTVNHIAARLKTCTGVDEANIAKLVQLAA